MKKYVSHITVVLLCKCGAKSEGTLKDYVSAYHVGEQTLLFRVDCPKCMKRDKGNGRKRKSAG